MNYQELHQLIKEAGFPKVRHVSSTPLMLVATQNGKNYRITRNVKNEWVVFPSDRCGQFLAAALSNFADDEASGGGS